MKKALVLVLLAWNTQSIAQVITPFSIRHQATQRGGIVYLSNTAVTYTGTGSAAAQTEAPPGGTGINDNFTAGYVDIDADGTTFMSSSDALSLQACSEITWAGLYWGAENSSGGSDFGTRSQVKIKVNSGAYVDLTADDLQDNAVGFLTYHCFKDVTSIVKAGGSTARFTVANVAARVGSSNGFGGWTIVVVYKNDLQRNRMLTVFNGLSNISASNPTTDINLSGFLSPLSGPVSFETGTVTYDGDRASTGDQLLFNGGGSFVAISDAANPANDIFNSTLSYNGIAKSSPALNPGYVNTAGYDADIFFPSNTSKNYIGNSSTSATIRLTTANPGGDAYLAQVVTMAIDVYEPDLRSAVRVEDLNGGTVQPGDILEYTVSGRNIGSDPSENTFLTDTLERNVTYVPGSIVITFGPNAGAKTDAMFDDQAEYIAASRVVKVRTGTGANGNSGGFMLNSTTGTDSTQFKFRVVTTSDCIVLQCDNVVDNRSYIHGTGNVSGNMIKVASNPVGIDGNSCPLTGTTAIAIVSSACVSPVASGNTPVCSGSALNLSVTGSPAASYAWSGPNSFSSTQQNPTITNVTASAAGTYTVNITIPGTSCLFSPTTTVALTTPTQTGQVAGTAGGGVSVQTHDVSIAGGNYTDGNCNAISGIQSSGATPVTGSVTSSVWIETAVPFYGGLPYVARHYDIKPAVNPTTSTGTVTLYFLQSEFDAFNSAAGANAKLPTGPADAAGIANTRAGEFPGNSTGNTGLPGSYGPGASVINPADGNITWNATAGRWEVTFNTVGFGGFILQTSPFVLPVTLTSFNGEKKNNSVLLHWQTSSEINSSRFEVEHSTNGNSFIPVGSVAASGNSSSPVDYGYTHNQPGTGTNYYRIKQIDLDGRFTHSSVITVSFSPIAETFRIAVNPVRNGRLQVSFGKAGTAQVCNLSGQVLISRKVSAGQHSIDVERLLPGVYLLKAGNETKKFVVE